MASQTRTIIPRVPEAGPPWPSLPAPTAPRPGSNFQNITTALLNPLPHRRFCIGYLTASPQPTLQPEATRMGSCPIQNPLGLPRDLRIKPQVPYHGLKGSRGPAPTSGSPGPCQKASVVATQVASGPLHTLEAPIARRLIRLVLAGSLLPCHKHPFPAFGASPPVCRRRPVPSQGCLSEAKSASGRRAAPCCPSHGSNLPHRAQDSSCRGPTAGAQTLGPSCEHGHPLLASSPTALTAPAAMLRAHGHR